MEIPVLGGIHVSAHQGGHIDTVRATRHAQPALAAEAEAQLELIVGQESLFLLRVFQVAGNREILLHMLQACVPRYGRGYVLIPEYPFEHSLIHRGVVVTGERSLIGQPPSPRLSLHGYNPYSGGGRPGDRIQELLIPSHRDVDRRQHDVAEAVINHLIDHLRHGFMRGNA